jgi:hypothetical protein
MHDSNRTLAWRDTSHFAFIETHLQGTVSHAALDSIVAQATRTTSSMLATRVLQRNIAFRIIDELIALYRRIHQSFITSPGPVDVTNGLHACSEHASVWIPAADNHGRPSPPQMLLKTLRTLKGTQRTTSNRSLNSSTTLLRNQSNVHEKAFFAMDGNSCLGDAAAPPEFESGGEPGIEFAADLWDALTHCVEPKGNEQVEQFFNDQASKSTGTTNASTQRLSPGSDALTVDKYTIDASEGLYHLLGLDKAGMPIKHWSWKPEWILAMREHQPDDNMESIFYWQVFENEDDSRTVLKSESAQHDFHTPESKDGDLVYRFKAKYRMGTLAYDKQGHYLISNFEPTPSHFEYAEHAMIGDNLTLRWSKSEVSEGARILNLKNGSKLTYGQINALGGDFFGTFDPICLGSTLEEQCKRFQAAYDTLGHDAIGVEEAKDIIQNRGKETSAIGQAAVSGQSTSQTYKDLTEPGPSSFGMLDKADEQLTRITWSREGPSYLRMAQLNLDHFGEDGRAAYNAGHLLALKSAASGDLETGYAMNAFADHFLGDAFAAGHIRTPRRALHGDNQAVQDAVNWVIAKIRQSTISHSKVDKSPNSLNTAWKAIGAVAPDICSKVS